MKILNGILLTFLLFIGSCSTRTNEDLMPYVDYYQKNLEQAGCEKVNLNTYSIEFSKDIPLNIYGYCMYTPYYKYIRISSFWWPLLSETERIILMVHEMNHCHFRIMHNDEKNHYMNAYMPSLSYEVFYKQFRKSLQQVCKK
jgi:chloramphenicol O-acetyltransferase